MMGYLKEYIDDLCAKCVSDRMSNVLSPMCRRRYLINIRILTGSKVEELPKFCYQQVISNVERYIKKKTTLFTPIDVLIYNIDFFELFFPKIARRLLETIQDGKLKEAHALINKSRVPAIPSRSKKQKPSLLRNILKRDKMIKEGSFIYDFDENNFIIWFNNTLYIANIENGYAVCNVHRKKIEPLDILSMILPLYAEGKEFNVNLRQDDEQVYHIKIRISGEKLIKIEEEIRDQKFRETIKEVGPKFPRASFNLDVEANLDLEVTVDKNCTYDDLNNLFNVVGTLSEVENINLLNEAK